MKYSIIVPVYNVEEYLDECLHSIKAQDYADYEVICVNDGSSDSSRDILSQWLEEWPQMKIIDRENGGLSAARNTGLQVAVGEYVLFVDSDDWLEPSALSVLEKHLDGTDIISFGCRRTDREDTDTITEEQGGGWDYYCRHALEARVVPFVCVWQRCYRRQFLMDNNLSFQEGILHEDNHFTPRAFLAAEKVSTIPHLLYHYRIRPGSIMTNRSLHNRESLILVANELSTMLDSRTGLNKTTLYRFLTHCYQMAFLGASHTETRHLQTLVDWEAYRRVSRTKLRHRINYTIRHVFYAR